MDYSDDPLSVFFITSVSYELYQLGCRKTWWTIKLPAVGEGEKKNLYAPYLPLFMLFVFG